MTNKPKAIGTAAETAVVKALRVNGFPNAERRALAGEYDLGDVVGTPGIVWEVKGGAAAKTASDGQVEAWLTETERERANANAVYGVLVMQRAGIGALRAGQWWAVMPADSFLHLTGATAPIGVYGQPIRVHLDALCVLLRHAGYGDAFLGDLFDA